MKAILVDHTNRSVIYGDAATVELMKKIAYSIYSKYSFSMFIDENQYNNNLKMCKFQYSQYSFHPSSSEWILATVELEIPA